MRPTIAVVGAGILGCLVATRLAERSPEADVVVLDRDGAGSGASRRSAGLHFPRGASERVRAMSASSEAYYRRLSASDPLVPIYPLDMTVIASREREGEVRDAYLPGAKLRPAPSAGHPLVRLPETALAWSGDGCQYADVYALTQYFAARLRSTARLRECVAVTALEPGPEGVCLRLGTGEQILADRAVLAPGPWVGAPAWRELLAPLGIRVKKVVALHVEDRPDDRDHCVVFHDEDAFLLPLRHRGHWLFSYTCQEWDVDPDQLTAGLARRHLDEARLVLARYAPELAARATSGRVFCDAYSPDRQPLVRMLDPAGRIVFAGAANGSGYRLAPAIAAEAVESLDLKPSRRSQ